MTRKVIFSMLLCGIFTYSFAQSNNNLKINAKPADRWELGIHIGHAMVTGDVDWDSNFGVGLHVRKSLDHIFSVRVDAGFYNFKGTEEENTREVDGARYGYAANWKPEYKSTMIGGDINLVASLNQFRANKKKKINPYLFAGAGVSSLSVEANDGSRKVDVLSLDYDDEWNITPYLDGGAGIGFLLSDKISLSIEHKLIKPLGRGSDLIDAVEWQGSLQDRVITNSEDLAHYTNLRLGITLGKDDKSMPLWWSSPLDMLSEDLAEVKARPELDLTDTDEDGVIDMLDQEPGTEKNCPVDTRGVILDSDKDGYVDCKDKEPHSPPGYEINSDGVAQIPAGPTPLTEGDVNRIVDAKVATIPTSPAPAATDWFLPMIHFNLDKYSIKNSEYGKLHNVATVMRLNPGVRVVVNGHTDKSAGNCYNDVLSYNRANAAIDYLTSKYGISRDRLILNWGGENTALVPVNGSNMMNRRVEFTVATSESEMGRPDCGVGNAGSGNSGSGGKGYSGNKEAGY